MLNICYGYKCDIGRLEFSGSAALWTTFWSAIAFPCIYSGSRNKYVITYDSVTLKDLDLR